MTGVRARLVRLLFTKFGFATFACLVFAGWALWSGGILDGAVAAKVRTSSVYAAPGTGLDTAAAERVIGNRRLVVILLKHGASLSGACHSVQRAAAGTLVVALSRDGDDFDSYACSWFPGSDKENFGKAFVAEDLIGAGLDEFVDRPLDAVKVIAVNYDQLAKSGTVPAGGRTISPSLPRFLLAAAAVGAVLVGSTLLYVVSRRAARVGSVRQARRDRTRDSRAVLSGTMAVVAQQIIDLDSRYAAARSLPTRTGTKGRGRAARRARQSGDFVPEYRQLTSDYTLLLADVAAADQAGETDFALLTARADTLATKLGALAAA